MNKIEELNNIISNSNNIVFFGGAGVSTESGIPDFRSVDGLYNQKYDYPPEQIVSHSFFTKYPKEFYKFYFDRMIYDNVLPNSCHKKLKELEDLGKLKCIVTQNIDGLHQLAGSKNVLELHGSVLRNYCTKCGKLYNLNELKRTDIPRCSCGGIIKPDVVLYEEALDDQVLYKAIKYIENCDTLIIGGTSLMVYPAASLINYFHGNNLIIINRSTLPADNIASLVIHEDIGKVFESIK